MTTAASAAVVNLAVSPTAAKQSPFSTDGGGVLGDNSTEAPGWGPGSFVSNVDGVVNKYAEFQVNLNALFGRTITIGDLQQISYDTKNNSSSSFDWDIRLYTVKVNLSDPGFYEDRFETPNINAGDNLWHTWTTDADAKVTNVYHRATDTNTPVNATLPDLHATYGSKEVLYLSFIAGYSGNTLPIANNLDGIMITLTNEDVANINLVPEPSSLLLSILGVAAIASLRNRRRRLAPF